MGGIGGQKPDVFSLNPLPVYSEGRMDDARKFSAASVPNTTFRRMIVLDVISDPDPSIITQQKIDYWRKVFGITNTKYAYCAPRNSIVAQLAYSTLPPLICYPFFPSHLSFPCKPGEVVWAVVENPEAQELSMAYWVCKITEAHHADDVNHSHLPRIYDPSIAGGYDKTSKVERAQNDGKTNPFYELRNGVVVLRNGVRSDYKNVSLMPTAPVPEYFEFLVTSTDGGLLSQYEAVPRFKKRPGDVVIEGSNNSLIVLGTDRAGSLGVFGPNSDGIPRPSFPINDFTGSAGSIDLVVGRGQVSGTFGKEVSTTSIIKNSQNLEKGIEIKKEIAKSEDEIYLSEGDVDYINDRSRILISQRTKVDQNFGIDEFNFSEFDVEDDKNLGDAAVVIKSDKIRLIARSDIEILVTGFNKSKNSINSDVKFENNQENSENFAAIIIKSNGDIIFQPSDSGYIKLGSNAADKALLCTDSPANQANGQVLASPISNTMGPGYVGTGGAGQGTWARKVLVD